MSYTLTQDEYRRRKTRLTRAINAGDPDKIIAEIQEAREQFEREGFPDTWARWRRAVDDLTFCSPTLVDTCDGDYDRAHDITYAAREESDRWF